MKKSKSIIQTNFSIDTESYNNYMVIAFTQDGQVTSTHIVKYPDWFKFYNSEYPYYSPCLN